MTLTWGQTQPSLKIATRAGERLVLRPWNQHDADAVYRACQDPEIVRWTRVPHPYTREHALSYSTASETSWQEHTGAAYAVADEATDGVLAACGLVDVNEEDCVVEVGYWVAPWARGRGVATAGTRALSGWALRDLGAQRVSLEAAVGNLGSQRVALNAGFTREGVQRSKAERFGERHDMVLFSLLPGEAQT
ncbi:GNAT family N-acetyltransferase [Arthrobacter sp. JSM 101049]|uniref:GNAT family N-acetyltransferase n=1 Tax=Arthrobacter sp. JSM 101049 TaxID=929097 RepID=UPI003567A2E2